MPCAMALDVAVTHLEPHHYPAAHMGGEPRRCNFNKLARRAAAVSEGLAAGSQAIYLLIEGIQLTLEG